MFVKNIIVFNAADLRSSGYSKVVELFIENLVKTGSSSRFKDHLDFE